MTEKSMTDGVAQGSGMTREQARDLVFDLVAAANDWLRRSGDKYYAKQYEEARDAVIEALVAAQPPAAPVETDHGHDKLLDIEEGFDAGEWNNIPGAEPCKVCGGSGFSGRGTGYDDVCGECGVLKCLPVSRPSAESTDHIDWDILAEERLGQRPPHSGIPLAALHRAQNCPKLSWGENGPDLTELNRMIADGRAFSGRETIAKIIYDVFPFTPTAAMAQKPEWVIGGNSLNQDEARRAADRIFALLRDLLPGEPQPSGESR